MNRTGETAAQKESIMNYLEKSILMAVQAHAGQQDKAGAPYILHPLRLMLQMEKAEEMSAAVLHDVIEDTPLTLEQLRNEGIPETVIEAVDRLTRKADEPYETFIRRIKGSPIAEKVKKADLKDNMNIQRFDELRETDLNRLRRYHAAYRTLSKSI